MSEIDTEIISIIKELFRSKKNELVDPDDLLREKIVKTSIYLAMLFSFTVLVLEFLNHELTSSIYTMTSVTIAVAFTLLFIHINNKSKNPSLIMFGLTWFSLMLTLYFSGL